MKKLYNDQDRTLMRSAEDCLGRINRIEALQRFAEASGFRRIGIAHCISFRREAAALREYLERSFEVESVDCKHGRLQSDDLLGTGNSKILCNPAGQAQYLNDRETEMNISLGLCVGHDMIFNSHSRAPVTTLFTKDFSTGHDPARALAEVSAG